MSEESSDEASNGEELDPEIGSMAFDAGMQMAREVMGYLKVNDMDRYYKFLTSISVHEMGILIIVLIAMAEGDEALAAFKVEMTK